MKQIIILTIFLSASFLYSLPVNVSDETGRPLGLAMVTVRSADDAQAIPQNTGFTSPGGSVVLDFPDVEKLTIRVRKPGFTDVYVERNRGANFPAVRMQKEKDPLKLAESRPANVWFHAINFENDSELKKHFKLQCAYCHQQGSLMTRVERNEEAWEKIVDRMLRIGSRLDNDAQGRIPKILEKGYKDLRAHPEKIPESKPWEGHIALAKITEWPIGDAASQFHDLMIGKDKKLYIGDNTQDKLYEFVPGRKEYKIYDIPHDADDPMGGEMTGLMNFPGNGAYIGAHSLAQTDDGHIFITCSLGKRLVEFNPADKKFTTHKLPRGHYPHTVRIDKKNRVWFTMAVSNQVVMLDRATGKFTYYDLPARSIMEKLTIFLMDFLWKLASWGVPVHKVPIQRDSDGIPLPYGIDITPDGNVWFTRLYADSIGMINPGTGEVKIISTPFKAPRRLRSDGDGNLWIVSFVDAKIVKYEPSSQKFTDFPLPTEPLGSDSPYSLAIDQKRNLIWVTGNLSDTLLSFHMKTNVWKIYPMPRRVTFPRELDIAEDGSIYTSNSNFPGWQIEGAKPAIIHLVPGL